MIIGVVVVIVVDIRCEQIWIDRLWTTFIFQINGNINKNIFYSSSDMVFFATGCMILIDRYLSIVSILCFPMELKLFLSALSLCNEFLSRRNIFGIVERYLDLERILSLVTLLSSILLLNAWKLVAMSFINGFELDWKFI